MGGTQRGVPMALLMGVIPLVHAYLFYKWCNEAKVHWRVEWLNSTLYAFLFLLPLLNIYPLYKFLSLVQSNFSAEGKKGYGLPPALLSLATILWVLVPFLPGTLICPLLLLPIGIAALAWLYIIYRTQSLFNENGVATL